MNWLSWKACSFVDQPALQAQKAQKPLPASGSLTLDYQSGPGGAGGGPLAADKQSGHLITAPPIPQIPAAPTRLERLLFFKEGGMPRVLWP